MARDRGAVQSPLSPTAAPSEQRAEGAGRGRASAGRSRRVRPGRADGIAVGVYVGLALLCYWHVWAGGPSHVYVKEDDGLQMMWFLNWVPYALGHGLDPFHTTLVNAPFGVNLLQNTSCELLGLVLAPVTVLFGPAASLALAQTLALAGSATSMYAVTRRFTAWRPAAFVGGLLYGFGPYEIGQGLAHLDLSFCVLPPLILLLVHDLAVRSDGRQRRRRVALGLIVVAQFFISTEVLTTTALMAVVLVVTLAVLGRSSLGGHVRPAASSLAWCLAVVAPLLAYPAFYGLAGPGHVNGPVQITAHFRADLLGPIVPDGLMALAPASLAATADHFGGNWFENGSYLGITLLVVLACGLLWLRHRGAAWAAAVFGTVAFVLSLGQKLVVRGAPAVLADGSPSGHLLLPWAALGHLPLLGNVLPVRFSLYVEMAAALLLALIVDALHDRWSSRSPLGAILVPAAVAVVALVPLVPVVPYANVAPTPSSRFFSSPLADRLPAGQVALLYPFPSADAPAGLLWQTEAGMRFATPGGYFLVPFGRKATLASAPFAYNAYPSVVADALSALYFGQPVPRDVASRTEMRAELAAWHVRTVVAIPAPRTERAAVSYLTWILGHAPRREADAYVWFGASAWLAPGPSATSVGG